MGGIIILLTPAPIIDPFPAGKPLNVIKTQRIVPKSLVGDLGFPELVLYGIRELAKQYYEINSLDQ